MVRPQLAKSPNTLDALMHIMKGKECVRCPARQEGFYAR
jgi:hypothetical protein